jgi:DNA repair protein RecO (recombination protein O)
MALEKTKGIVLHHIKYGDTSIIAYLYTEKFGRQAFMVNGARSKKANLKANLFQPLFVHNLEIYYNQKRDLQRIKELKNIKPFRTIPYDIVKNSISLFLAEVLYRCLREQESGNQLFNFLLNSIELLDTLEEGAVNYHLLFLVQLSRFLGFYPNDNRSSDSEWFDLQDGNFCNSKPVHNHVINKDYLDLFDVLRNTSMTKPEALVLTKLQRDYLLDKLIEYYKLHLGHFGDIKSVEVLKTVFSG